MDIEWHRVIEQTIGVLLGGGITITAIWVKALFDRRAGAQAWFEQTYITDGIEKILSYLKIAELNLTTLTNLAEAARRDPPLHPLVERAYTSDAILPFPFDPLIRLWLLLRSDDVVEAVEEFRGPLAAYSTASVEMRTLDFLQRDVRRLKQIIQQYVALREDLLEVKLKRRSDVHNIHSKANYQEILSRMSQLLKDWEKEDQRYLTTAIGEL